MGASRVKSQSASQKVKEIIAGGWKGNVTDNSQNAGRSGEEKQNDGWQNHGDPKDCGKKMGGKKIRWKGRFGRLPTFFPLRLCAFAPLR